jgi:hypothetical protein
MDLPARAYCLNMAHHNGHHSCHYCEAANIGVLSGGGIAKYFPFQAEPATGRTPESVLQTAKDAEVNNKEEMGLKGRTVLTSIPIFSPCTNIAIDYMHGSLSGISKKLLTLFTDGVSYHREGSEHFIGHKVKVIDRKLRSIQVPYIINRPPRACCHDTTSGNHQRTDPGYCFTVFRG